MPFLKKQLCNAFLVLMVSFFLISCGSIQYFKKSAGNKEGENTDQIKISALESELLDAKQNLTNLDLQIKNKTHTILKLQNNILRLKKKISFLENKIKSAKPGQKKRGYPSPLALYKKARNLLVEENYENAAALFNRFVKDYPQNSLADNALYWLAECHYSLGDYKKAILVFKNLETRYPRSEKVPDAILKLGYSYLSLDDSNRAHHFLKKVIKKYPFSPAAEKAQKKLRLFD